MADYDTSRVSLRIIDPKSNDTIGNSRLVMTSSGDSLTINAETRYASGEHDNEVIQLRKSLDGEAPRLASYAHDFFGADNTLQMRDSLDVSSGMARCEVDSATGATVHSTRLDVPVDTLAGSAELMMLERALRQGRRDISFHAFACVSYPRIFAVEVQVPNERERWPHYPGDLARLDMRPDLGAIGIWITPILPRLDAWFDPENWSYVGGEFDRYFRGPHVIAVRERTSE